MKKIKLFLFTIIILISFLNFGLFNSPLFKINNYYINAYDPYAECGPGVGTCGSSCLKCSGGACVDNGSCVQVKITPPPPNGATATATPPQGGSTGGATKPSSCGGGCCVCSSDGQDCLGSCGAPGLNYVYYVGYKSNGTSATNQSACTNYASDYTIDVSAKCVYAVEGLDCGDGQPFTPSCSWTACGGLTCALVKDHGYEITAKLSVPNQYQYWNNPDWWGGPGVTGGGSSTITYLFNVPNKVNGDETQSFTLNHQGVGSKTTLYISNGTDDYTTNKVTEKIAPLYLYTQITDSLSGFMISPTYTNGSIDYSRRITGSGDSFKNISTLQNQDAFTENVWDYGNALVDGNTYDLKATFNPKTAYSSSSDTGLVNKVACTNNSNIVNLGERPLNDSCANSSYTTSPLTISQGTTHLCIKYTNDSITPTNGTVTNTTNNYVIRENAGEGVNFNYDISSLNAGTYTVNVSTPGEEPYCAASNNNTFTIPSATPTPTPQIQLSAPVISVQSNTSNSITWKWTDVNSNKADRVWFQISTSPSVNAGGSYPGSFVSTLTASSGTTNGHIDYPTLTNTNTSLSCGTDYYAHIRAEDSNNVYLPSGWSNVANFSIPCPSALISGSLFADTDGNGVKDSGEGLVDSSNSITVIPTYQGGSNQGTVSCIKPTSQTYTCTFSNFSDGVIYNIKSANLSPYSSQTGCSGSLGNSCSVTINDGANITLNLGFIKGPFLQTSGGSVHAGGGVSMNIPSSPIAFDGGSNTARVMVLNNAGVVTSNGTQTYSNIAGAQASTPNYIDASYTNNSSQFNYAFFANKLTSKTQTFTPSGGAKLENGKITDLNNATNNITLENNKVYLVKGDLEVNNSTSISGVNSVILVNGNITISSNFKPTNSYLAFIASGTLTIDPVVSEINAILHSDGLFSDGDSSQINVLGLKITGAISTNTGFSLVRRQTTDKPGEYIIFDPAFYIKLENTLGLSSRFWSEVMP